MEIECHGFQTVFGFTDSIFIRHDDFVNTTTTDLSNQHIAKLLQDCQASIKHKD
jgi:hypothetical protein